MLLVLIICGGSVCGGGRLAAGPAALDWPDVVKQGVWYGGDGGGCPRAAVAHPPLLYLSSCLARSCTASAPPAALSSSCFTCYHPVPVPSPLCSEEYFPTVSINALMRVLRDPSLSSQQSVIDALMAILRWAPGPHTLTNSPLRWVPDPTL